MSDNQIKLFIVTDELDVLKEENQSIEDYQKQKIEAFKDLMILLK